MTSSNIIILIGSILNISIGFFVFLKDTKNPLYRSFCTMTAGIGMWGIGFTMIIITQSLGLANMVTLWGSIIAITGLWNFSKNFPHTHKTSTRKNLIHYIPLIAFMCIIPFRLIIKDVSFASGFPEAINGPLFIPYALTLILYLLLSLFNLFKTFKSSNVEDKNRMLYFLSGVAMFSLLVIVFDIILPGIGISHLNAIGPASTIIISITTTYAILRHNIMDIRVIIQRGLIYLFILAVIVTSYLSLLALFHTTLSTVANPNIDIIIGLVITILGIFTVPHIDHYLRRVTDHIFFKDQYVYDKELLELSHSLHELIYIEDIKQEIPLRLSKIFRAESCDFVVAKNKKTGLIDQEFQYYKKTKSLYIPVKFKKRLLATIIMQPKKSGDTYTLKDRQLLQTFSYHIATACEKAQLLDEVSEYSQNLEEKVITRTKEIKQLQHNQEQMIIDLTHNLQTPLTVLKSELFLLNKNNKTDISDTFLNFERSLDSVSRFIKRLLHLSHKKLNISEPLEELDLSICLQEVSEYLKTIAENDNITYNTQIQTGMYILGDCQEIEELLTNLVSNAIKYRSTERQSKIDIRAYPDKHNIIIEVIDNGIGIKAENKELVFERSYREDESNMTGNGLGLAICNQIATKHKGEITLESTHGKGSIFTISLPRK